MRLRLSDLLCAAGAGGAGAVWGLGLARFLALEAHLSFLLGGSGTMLIALLTGTAALVFWFARVRGGLSPCQVSFQLVGLGLPVVDLLFPHSQAWRGAMLLVGGLLVTVAVHLQHPMPAWGCFLFAAGVPLAFYLPDVAPWVGRADTFEFQVVAPRLGIAHPSGYPLYVLVGKLFSLLPVGTMAWRVNLSSAVCASLAAWFLYRAVEEGAGSSFSPESDAHNRRSSRPRSDRLSKISGLLASLTLAFSPTLWARAVEAEVYALNALLVALTLWVLVRWAQTTWATERALPLLGLLAGVGVASHLTLGATLFLIVPMALSVRPRLSLRSLLLALPLFLAGLALYLYIPLRWPAVNDGELMTVSHFLAFVTNAESTGALRPLAFLQDPARWGAVFRLMRMQVGWGGLGLAMLGLIRLFRRRSSLALGLGTTLACVAWVWFNLGFYVAEPDYSAFLIPAHVILTFWLGIGLAWLFHLLQERAAIFLPVLLAVTALLPLSRIWLAGPALDAHQEQADEAWGRYVLGLPIEPDGVILADSEKFPPLYYLQQVEGIRTDLDLVMRFDEAGYWEELGTRIPSGQTVYVARYLPHLEAYYLRSLGPLVEVGRAPLTALPPGITLMAATFDGQLELLALDLQRDVDRSLYHLTLYWRSAGEVHNDLHVRFRFVDGTGSVLWKSDGVRPVGGLYPTNGWPEGAVIPDYHELAIPYWLPDGNYRLEVGLFPPFSETGLIVDGGTLSWSTLGTLELESALDSLPPLPYEQHDHFAGGAWLIGSGLASQAVAGAPLAVDLAWRGVEMDSQVCLSFSWSGTCGPGEAVFVLPAGSLRTRHVITAPHESRDYALHVGLIGEVARCGWLAPPTQACALASVNVIPAQEGLANFADLMLLLEADIQRDSAQASQVIPAVLRWRALQTMDQDYTVFVQLIGPDGRLYGQVDTWPMQGSRPTSGWVAGEELSDLYEVRLDPDSPPGDYQVVVGWYLLATMRRLSTVDADGRPVGDHFTVGKLTVTE